VTLEVLDPISLQPRSLSSTQIRDAFTRMGYVAGGLLAGIAADALSYSGAIAIVAVLTAGSGLWVAIELREGEPRPAAPGSEHLNDR
jgi:hypothetical protein